MLLASGTDQRALRYRYDRASASRVSRRLQMISVLRSKAKFWKPVLGSGLIHCSRMSGSSSPSSPGAERWMLRGPSCNEAGWGSLGGASQPLLPGPRGPKAAPSPQPPSSARTPAQQPAVASPLPRSSRRGARLLFPTSLTAPLACLSQPEALPGWAGVSRQRCPGKALCCLPPGPGIGERLLLPLGHSSAAAVEDEPELCPQLLPLSFLPPCPQGLSHFLTPGDASRGL